MPSSSPSAALRVASDPHIAPTFEAEPLPCIALVCCAEETEVIARAARPLRFDITSMTAWPPDIADDDDRFTAVVVSDAVGRSLDLCRRLSAHRPVGLVTADNSFAFRLAAARAGIDALLPRPLDTNALGAWLEQHALRQARRPFTILIVDDDGLAAELHAMALRQAGMEVEIATDAVSALEHVDAAVPDLVLLDLQMPEVTGLEIARMIRQNRRLTRVPIVFLSGERDAGRQLEARRFGGDEFVQKPIALDHLVAIVRLRAERAEVMRAAIERDGLTGLLNHSRFKERLAHELDRCDRTGSEVSLAMIDLDHFKAVNDTHGHPTGDAVIRALATSLTAGLRRIDIVGRYGGEEFGVIMLDTPPVAAGAAIDRERRRFRSLDFTCGAERFRVGFSAGLAGSRDNPDVESIVAAADRALYDAKRSGRDRVVVSPGRPPAPAA